MTIVGKVKQLAIKYWSDEELRKQFIRYMIIGFSCFTMEYLTFCLLRYIFEANGISLGPKYPPEVIASSIAMVIFFLIVFFLNRKWSFKSSSNIFLQFFLMVLLFIFNCTITNILLVIIKERLALSPLLSKLVIMGMIVCWNFILYRRVIYK